MQEVTGIAILVLANTRKKKQYELKIGKLVLIGIRLHTSLEA